MKLAHVATSLSFAVLVAGAPAAATPYTGTLGISVAGLGPAAFSGASSGTSTPSQVTAPGGTFMGTAVLPLTAPNPPITEFVVKIAGNLAGSFAGDPLAGTMPVQGVAVIKGFIGGPFTLASVPFFTAHAPGSAASPNGLGVGGSVLLVPGPGLYLNVFNTDWSEGMKTVTGVFYTYTYHYASGMHASLVTTAMYTNGTAMYTGTDSRTPGGLGQVTLVSPTKVVTNVTGALEIFVIAGSLTLNFVPEPGTLLLLGSGVAGLALLGRRRMGPR